MRLWPWSVLARAKLHEQAAAIDLISAKAALEKAGNLWKEAHDGLRETDEHLAAADYRIRRGSDESWAEYRIRLADILHEGRMSSVALAVLDRLDARTRSGYRDWLVTKDPAEAESIRLRVSAIADFRSELVAALYAKTPGQRREEIRRKGQDHARIYLDERQGQGAAQRP